jgi:hypothetical protein
LDTKFKLPRILNYNLYFKIEPEENFFNALGVLIIGNETEDDYNQLSILLYHGLKVSSIKDGNNKALSFTEEKISLKDEEKYYINHICVTLDDVLKPEEQIDLYIEYEGGINGYSHLMTYVKDKIDKEFSIIRPDSHGYPIIAQPCYDSIAKSYKNIFTYNLSIDVPKEYTVGCGGVLKEIVQGKERNVFKYSSDLQTWRFDIGIAQYSIVEDKDMKLKIFVFPEHEANAENVVRNEIKRAFHLFICLFGDYGKHNYFTVIEVKESFGSQAGDNYIMMEEHGFSSDVKKLTHLYHEIGHAWNVKAKQDVQKTRFFDEAFASYFEALAIKKFYGDRAFEDKMEFYRKQYIESIQRDETNFSTPICDYGKFDLGYNSYTKGPWVLYVLNEILGDDIFNNIIRNFLKKFRYKEVDFKDFQEIVEEISGVNLNNFFTQWIYGIDSSKFLNEGIGLSFMISNAQKIDK